MYNKTRNEAAILLWVSTRSIDRYIKSWKLRSQKIWKMIYINDLDLNNIWSVNKKDQHVIIHNQKRIVNSNQIESNSDIKKMDYIYKELINTIKVKDKKIEELSTKIGNAEQIIKSSISLIDYKKSQYLLEQKEETTRYEMEKSIKENNNLLEKEKYINKILLIIWFLLLITSIILWFSNI